MRVSAPAGTRGPRGASMRQRGRLQLCGRPLSPLCTLWSAVPHQLLVVPSATSSRSSLFVVVLAGLRRVAAPCRGWRGGSAGGRRCGRVVAVVRCEHERARSRRHASSPSIPSRRRSGAVIAAVRSLDVNQPGRRAKRALGLPPGRRAQPLAAVVACAVSSTRGPSGQVEARIVRAARRVG